MMNCLFEGLAQKAENRDKILLYTSRLFTPALFCGTILIALSYIVDLTYTNSIVHNLGEATSYASVIYNLGSIISKLSLPLISLIIALLTGGAQALPSGIIAGLIIISGSTAQNISGSIAGVSGIWGCVAAGYLSGYTVTLCKKATSKKTSKASAELFCPCISLILTILGVFAINSISEYLRLMADSFLIYAGGNRSIVLPIILGIFITADPGGPLFLSSYIFGASSLATGESQIMAAVTAAGMIPPLAIGLFAFIYKEKLEPFERTTAYCSIPASLAGIPQLCFPFYVSKSHKFILPCIIGGCISSILSVLLGCKTEYPIGGFLTFPREGKPFFFIVAIICGVITSSALMNLTFKERNKDDATDSTEQKQSVAQT